jgi:hypothetical protein
LAIVAPLSVIVRVVAETPHDPATSCVENEIADNYGESIARFVEDGREKLHTFDAEWFAKVYAEKERIRLLGEKEVGRL